MTILSKPFSVKSSPQTYGNPGQPGIPYVPGHWVTFSVTKSVRWESPSYWRGWTYFPSVMLLQPRTYSEVRWVPAQDGQPYIPPSPPSPAQISHIRHRGWDSSSRTIEPLLIDSGARFYCNTGISGAMFGIGIARYRERTFVHALVLDNAGVKVLENNAVVKTLINEQVSTSEIRIYRQADNTIVYTILTDGKTVVYKSNIDIPYNSAARLYLYAWLYSSGDAVLSADTFNGEVKFGAA